jgi:hypothetical protein
VGYQHAVLSVVSCVWDAACRVRSEVPLCTALCALHYMRRAVCRVLLGVLEVTRRVLQQAGAMGMRLHPTVLGAAPELLLLLFLLLCLLLLL